jgi:hypothetical protein
MLFAKVNMVIEEIKNALTRSIYFYMHFQIQVQAIAMQKISPNTIPAKNLRNVLRSIREELPKTVGLPHDPRTHLFEYYKFLKSVTIFDGNHVIITTFIPLVEYSYQFDIFQTYLLLVPLVNRREVENNNKDLFNLITN